MTARPPRQHGAALFLFLAIIGLAVLIFVGYRTRNSGQLEISGNAASALALAKDAVIGYAVSPTSAGQRPGDMPLPDHFASTESPANYDGKSDACLDATQASGLPLVASGVNMRCLGRLPWSNLNVSIQGATESDATGVMPWYAVSANLVDPACLGILNSDTITLPTPAINGDATHSYASPGCTASPTLPATLPHPWLTVRDASGNVISSRVAVVLIIPGPPLGGQSRPASPLADASAYLDSVTVGGTTYSNADMDNDFIIGTPSATFNDTVLFITIDELMAAVEKRVAAEAGNVLKTFYNTCGFYPKPVDFSSSACYTVACSSDTTKSQGRFPSTPKPAGSTTYPDWSGLPTWFQENRWDAVLYYAVGNGFKSGGDGATLLTVDGSASARALFFTPRSNPAVNRVTGATTLGNYLQDAENTNLDTLFKFKVSGEKGYQRGGSDTSGYTPGSPNPVCGCPAGQTVTWTVSGTNCSATTSAGLDGATASLNSTLAGTSGTAAVFCNVGVWQVSASPAATCTGSGGTWPFDYSDSGPTGWPGIPPLDPGTVAVGGGSNINSSTAGDDKFSVTGDLVTWVDLKGGNDQLLVTGDFVGGGSLGSGNDTVKIGGNLAGYVTMGQGNDYLDIGGNATGWIDAKEGDDNIIIGGSLISGADLGSGNDNLYIKGSLLGSLATGEGDDKVRIEGSATATIELNSGDDYLLIFGDALYINGGSGDDVVLVGGNANSWIDLGEGSDYFEVLGNSAGLDAGGDNDTIKIHGSATNTVNLGSGNDILVIEGTFTWISGGSGTDKVYLGHYTTSNCATLLSSKIASDVENVKVSNGMCRGSDFTVP